MEKSNIVKEVMLNRRSIRKFKSTKISEEVITDLLECAMASPSACNKTPWEFYVIENEELLVKIKSASLFTKYNAPLAIVVGGNTNKSLSKKDNDFWIQDCASSVAHILLRCESLDLGAVWCGLYPMERSANKVREILNIPSSIIPMALIFIGYKNEERAPRTQYNEKKVHYYK